VARDVAWVVPGNLHLTVKFLGAVADGRIGSIVGALTGTAADVSPFDANFAGLGAFPSATRARVVWAGVTGGAGAMVDLAVRVDAALAALGFARDERPFSPHITLGRVRQPGRNPALTQDLRSAAGQEFGRLHVAGVSLMRSELLAQGARYTELATVSLRGDVGRRV